MIVLELRSAHRSSPSFPSRPVSRGPESRLAMIQPLAAAKERAGASPERCGDMRIASAHRDAPVLHVPMTLKTGERQRHIARRGAIQVRALRRIAEVVDRTQKRSALAG